MSDSVTYVVRTEGMANSYGIGKEVSQGVALFEAGKYHLTYDELQKELVKLPKGKIKLG
jgi:hypothetical protein